MEPSELHFLHSAGVLNWVKLDLFRRLSTDEIKASLQPGQPGSLKARPDGTVLDGHHRFGSSPGAPRRRSSTPARDNGERLMKPDLFWIPGPWRGRLAVATRPRGGDWLEDELRSWREAGVDLSVSLLEPDEAAQLDLS